MPDNPNRDWEKKIVTPDAIISMIKPGMTIFLGTALAEPRTLLHNLMHSNSPDLQDLELVQLVSLGDAISIDRKFADRFRLKTFFGEWVVNDAITMGNVDLIPSRFSEIPGLIDSGRIKIDVAFIQITPPDEDGYSSLGVAIDVARQAMKKASLVVGEINYKAPRTRGDTFVHMNDFQYLVMSQHPPVYFRRWEVNDVYDKLTANVASLIHDGDCVCFSVGPLFEALAKHLFSKKNLGIHTPFFTDSLMDLIKSGAVTNRRKKIFRNKTLASYALGTPELMTWLDRNPLIEFQGIDIVADPQIISQNDNFILILPARKVDLTGGIALHSGKGILAAGPAEAHEFHSGASSSRGGRTIIALPSRNQEGQSNIIFSVSALSSQLSIRESLDIVVTEYGIASLKGRTIRERALALIDIAHPDDRPELIRLARTNQIIYPKQIYIEESGHLYPNDLTCSHIFKGLRVNFRAIKPSDADEMRRFFYRFSNESIYYRYFAPIESMPYDEVQEYVNVDFRKIISIVALVGEAGKDQVIAEARYTSMPENPYADVAFIVDENYRRQGIGAFMFDMLMNVAKQRGIQGFTAAVLDINTPMLKLFDKMTPHTIKSSLDKGVFKLTLPFS